ncbi:hypothetical protein CRM22_002986 [Opisthorchis felineus]|uniref:Uncharacterized protein n=1 Tax=Opisthorchis felineus TaxID=147828 RepID=A0A4S2M3G3_OPIFE|nr:hypothetical protein CRM22_002986 [Opisthorchis felineus]
MTSKVEIFLGDRAVLLRTIKRRSIWTSNQRQHVTHAVGRNNPTVSTWSCTYCSPQRLVVSISSCNFGVLCYTMCPNDQLFLLMKPRQSRIESERLRPSSVVLSSPQTFLGPRGSSWTGDLTGRNETATVLFRVQFKQAPTRCNRFYLKLVVQCLRDGLTEFWMDLFNPKEKPKQECGVAPQNLKNLDERDAVVVNLNSCLNEEYVLRLASTREAEQHSAKLALDGQTKRTRPPEPVGVQLLELTYAPGRGQRDQWMNYGHVIQ